MNRLIAGVVGIAILITVIYMSGALTPPKGGDLSPEAALEKIENHPGTIIDVRTPGEYAQGHLKEVDQLIDFMDEGFRSAVLELDRAEPYYLYCRSGNRSGQAMAWMQQNGFREVYNIGGYQELVDSGFESDR